MKNYTLIYIDGAWVKWPESRIKLSTEKVAGQITLATAADFDRAAAAARAVAPNNVLSGEYTINEAWRRFPKGKV